MPASNLVFLLTPWLQGGGYQLFDDPVWFVIALVLIVLLGLALIARARSTPEMRAEYHLEAGHGEDTSHSDHAGYDVVEAPAAVAATINTVHHDPSAAALVQKTPAVLVGDDLGGGDTDDLETPPHSPYPPPEEQAEAPVAEQPKSSASTAPRESVPDDLKIIEGIGPKISALLAEHGITTFAALADSNPTELNRILDEAGMHIHDALTWPDQAQLAAAGDWERLSELQAGLKGGRREPGQTA